MDSSVALDGRVEEQISGSAGVVRDFISGELVRATPEEVSAVQVFARRLVEDYGYPASHIQTRPQHRVRSRPSDESKTYPVDIAVFDGEQHLESNIQMVIECKRPNREEGEEQLQLYLDMSAANVGVWFNGEDHLYLRKIHHKGGSRTYEVLPNIPRFGQRIEDIGLFTRGELVKPSNLKAVFRDIRNHLAGSAVGVTRDEALAREIINLLFCKIYDELNTPVNDTVKFRCGVDEDPELAKARILSLFEEVKSEYSDVFDETDVMVLDDASLTYVVGELQNYSITEADRDAVGDAFEVFIGPALRGEEGQFFTPRNVVKMAVEILDPEPGEVIMDPSCGSGGFLIVALEYVWGKLEDQAEEMGWDAVALDRKKRDVATRYFRGIDKDSFLAKVTKSYMAIVGDGRGGIFCENSLNPPSEWSGKTRDRVAMEKVDVLLTNPPFGKKIKIRGQKLLSQYRMGYEWKLDKDSGELQQTSKLRADQPPQILFIERCLQLLKPGGRMGIVLPEAVFGMPKYQYVVKFLEQHATIRGVISMPEPLFKTSGKGGTHAKVCVALIEKRVPTEGEDPEIFLAEAKWCGHDSRGNPTIRIDADGNAQLLDDVPLIADRYRELFPRGIFDG
ncbi:MAG: N-6 DNA methylase [Solirubrobacterales bacterium]